MKKFKPNYSFADLWKQFVMFTKNWRRKSTGELVNKDTLELGDVTANDIEVRDIKCRKITGTGKIKTTGDLECKDVSCEDIDAGNITGDSIIENMEGYSAAYNSLNTWSITNVYTSAVKNGNKLTLVAACTLRSLSATPDGEFTLVDFTIPESVANKLYNTNIGGVNLLLNGRTIITFSDSYGNIGSIQYYAAKPTSTKVRFALKNAFNLTFDENTNFYIRLEATFLLSDDIVS